VGIDEMDCRSVWSGRMCCRKLIECIRFSEGVKMPKVDDGESGGGGWETQKKSQVLHSGEQEFGEGFDAYHD
jgi:hypothetical protein